MRKFDLLEVVLAVLTLFVVLMILATIMALAYPDVTSSIISDMRQRAGGGDSAVFALFSQLRERLVDGFKFRVAPFTRRTVDLVNKNVEDIRKALRPTPKVFAFKAADCLKCHKKLFEERTFAHIYVDHRLHDSLDIACADCHSDTKHPKPKPVAQAVCIDCHKDQRASTNCATCHPPGSIKEVIAKGKTQEFLAGRSGGKSLVEPTFAVPDRAWLEHSSQSKGADEVPCNSCHDSLEFCNTCHMVFHDKLAGWRQNHGPRLLRREYTQNSCWSCHSATWCADTCHAVPGNVRRREFRPAPMVPLKDYLR